MTIRNFRLEPLQDRVVDEFDPRGHDKRLEAMHALNARIRRKETVSDEEWAASSSAGGVDRREEVVQAVAVLKPTFDRLKAIVGQAVSPSRIEAEFGAHRVLPGSGLRVSLSTKSIEGMQGVCAVTILGSHVFRDGWAVLCDVATFDFDGSFSDPPLTRAYLTSSTQQ
ncbi:MAG: hypothetical protein FJ319_13435 [SAR202 cluster bacterium]|nr:hypothetical protein [SAR202 cluster bacterium]